MCHIRVRFDAVPLWHSDFGSPFDQSVAMVSRYFLRLLSASSSIGHSGSPANCRMVASASLAAASNRCQPSDHLKVSAHH
jgi:hypothetical protein